jgi:hypothetical protein
MLPLSAPPASPPDPVPPGYIRLILIHENHLPFYLQIPLDIITSLCVKPRKYLIFLGWCILGVEGGLALNPAGEGIETDGDLEDEGIYYFVSPEGSGKALLFRYTRDADIKLTDKHRFPLCG